MLFICYETSADTKSGMMMVQATNLYAEYKSKSTEQVKESAKCGMITPVV